MPNIPKPKNHGLTPEAAQALTNQGVIINPDDIASEPADNPLFPDGLDGEPEFIPGGTSDDSVEDVGQLIQDAEIVDEPPVRSAAPVLSSSSRSRSSTKDTGTGKARTPKTGPPDLDEWMHFFSNVVLRVACDFYLSMAFRGIDEELLSERDLARLSMSDDERTNIVRPFAELSTKNKWMRKHGREIVSTADSIFALLAFGTWASRVNRIAKKYRPPKARVVNKKGGQSQNGSSGSASQSGSSPLFGANGGRFPNSDGITVINPNS